MPPPDALLLQFAAERCSAAITLCPGFYGFNPRRLIALFQVGSIWDRKRSFQLLCVLSPLALLLLQFFLLNFLAFCIFSSFCKRPWRRCAKSGAFAYLLILQARVSVYGSRIWRVSISVISDWQWALFSARCLQESGYRWGKTIEQGLSHSRKKRARLHDHYSRRSRWYGQVQSKTQRFLYKASSSVPGCHSRSLPRCRSLASLTKRLETKKTL